MLLIPMSFQGETKTRRLFELGQGPSQAHIRSDRQRASNGQKDKRMSLILKAHWNQDAFRATTWIVAWFLAIRFSGRKPRQFVLG